MKNLSRLAMLGLCISPNMAVAAEKAPVSLARTTKWEMRYDDDSCSLLAQFAGAKDAATLAITKVSPGDWFEMRIYGKMLTYGTLEMPIEVAFGNGAPIRRNALSATGGGDAKLPAAIISGLRLDGWEPDRNAAANAPVPMVSTEQEKAIRSITFKPPGKGRYRLETGSLGAPLAAMRTCTDNLVKSWGYDPAVQASLKRPATPTSNPASWLGSNDFPTKALMEGMNGYVKFRLDVDPEGNVSGCRILYRTNPDQFADTSCRLLSKRAKFVPALDAAGRPVKSYFMSAIKWVSAG